MSKLVKSKTDGAGGVISFFRNALNFSQSPYTTGERVKKIEETEAIKSATQRVKDETEKVKALQGFEKAKTGYVSEYGKYGVAAGELAVETNKQKAKLLNVAGDIRESEAEVYSAQGEYERRRQEAVLAARTKHNVGAFK